MDLLYGHINNVAFFKYIQSARVEYWEKIGLTHKLYLDSQIGAILASSKCSFLKPLSYPGNITIETMPSFLKTTSFGLKHQIFNEARDLCAEGEDIIVVFDYAKGEKMIIPAGIRATMEGEGKGIETP